MSDENAEAIKDLRSQVLSVLRVLGKRIADLHAPPRRSPSPPPRQRTLQEELLEDTEEGELPGVTGGPSSHPSLQEQSNDAPAAHMAPALASGSLGTAKPSFPRFQQGKTDIASFFNLVDRYFRVCSTNPNTWIDCTLLALGDTYASWWDTHLSEAGANVGVTWEYFKDTITSFVLGEDPTKAALTKLLHTRQSNSQSLTAYAKNFMNLVRDSRTKPTEPWLILKFLSGLGDANIRRTLSSNNGTAWSSITELLQSLSAITAFEPSSNASHNRNNSTGYAGKHKQHGFKKHHSAAPTSNNKGNTHSLNAVNVDVAAEPKKFCEICKVNSHWTNQCDKFKRQMQAFKNKQADNHKKHKSK
jgi:hypothetical protein